MSASGRRRGKVLRSRVACCSERMMQGSNAQLTAAGYLGARLSSASCLRQLQQRSLDVTDGDSPSHRWVEVSCWCEYELLLGSSTADVVSANQLDKLLA